MRKRTKSWGETYIKNILDKKGIKYIREKKFPGCVSPKNNPLRFDFYLPEYHLLIEFQGKHHYEPVSKRYRAKKVHEYTKVHDMIKKIYCHTRKIPLIEIPYYHVKSEEDVQKYLKKEFDKIKSNAE